MKILKTITTLSILLLTAGTVSNAISPVSINEPSLVKENTTQQVMSSGLAGSAFIFEKLEALNNRYNADFANCEQLHFDQYIDLFGLKFKLKFDINGWIDGKCEMKGFANVMALGKDIREVFNINVSDEQIAAIKPAVECHFTKDQLKVAIDAYIARSKQNEAAISKMLESPEKAISQKREVTPEEAKLMAMLMTENVCTIPNKDTLKKQIDELMGIGTK